MKNTFFSWRFMLPLCAIGSLSLLGGCGGSTPDTPPSTSATTKGAADTSTSTDVKSSVPGGPQKPPMDPSK